jgi:dynein heavy chain 1
MRDFPLDELLAATDQEKIQESVYLIFAHLNKKLKLSFVNLTSFGAR